MPLTINDGMHHQYPNLAKPDSDGVFCYYVQRRISCIISAYCHSIGMSPNTATIIDAIFAVLAGIAFYFHFFIWGVLFIQLFGIWSCVDGELARLSGKTSTLGDFYDTMVDRAGELIIVTSILFTFNTAPLATVWGYLLFAYIGAVFLITNSSEKFRSTYHKNYPKNRIEPFFSWICAGSDIRLFHLSMAILWFALTESSSVLLWVIFLMTGALFINFSLRMRKIYNFDQSISS